MTTQVPGPLSPHRRAARRTTLAALAVLTAPLLVLGGGSTAAAAPAAPFSAPFSAAVPLGTATTGYGVLLSSYESALMDGINAQRAAAGLAPLRVAGGATDVARGWSRVLASRGALSHNPDLGAQLDANGSSSWTIAGENVASGGSAASVVTAWMNSPAHRANILNGRFTVVGVGTIVAGGRSWSTTTFADAADGRQPASSPDTTGETGPAPAPPAPPSSPAPAAPSSQRVATLGDDGVLRVKEGSFYATWTTVATGVRSFDLDGLRVVVVTSDGTAQVKEGSLSAPWTVLATGTTGAALSGSRIAVLGAGGSVQVKEGSVSALWTPLWSRGATAVELDGARIGVVSGATAYVKEGSVGAQWVAVAGDVDDLALSGTRIAVVVRGTAYAKQGGLSATYVVLSAASDVELAGDRIAVLVGRQALVKDGLYSRWTTVAAFDVTDVSITAGQVGVVEAGTVRVKAGSLSSPWVDQASGTRMAVSS